MSAHARSSSFESRFLGFQSAALVVQAQFPQFHGSNLKPTFLLPTVLFCPKITSQAPQNFIAPNHSKGKVHAQKAISTKSGGLCGVYDASCGRDGGCEGDDGGGDDDPPPSCGEITSEQFSKSKLRKSQVSHCSSTSVESARGATIR